MELGRHTDRNRLDGRVIEQLSIIGDASRNAKPFQCAEKGLLFEVRKCRDLYGPDSAQGRQMERASCTAGTDDPDSQWMGLFDSAHLTPVIPRGKQFFDSD
jgi:hypothetical protein